MVSRADNYPVGTSAVMLCSSVARRTGLGISNQDTTKTLYIDSDPGVTTSTGWPIGPGLTMVLSAGLGDEPDLAYYGISTAASCDVRVIEQYGKQGA